MSKLDPIPPEATLLRLLVATVSLLGSNEALNGWKLKNQDRIDTLSAADKARFNREIVDRKRQIRMVVHNHPRPDQPPLKRSGRPKKVMSCDIKGKNNDTE